MLGSDTGLDLVGLQASGMISLRRLERGGGAHKTGKSLGENYLRPIFSMAKT